MPQERDAQTAKLRQMIADAEDEVAECEMRLGRCEDDLQCAQDDEDRDFGTHL